MKIYTEVEVKLHVSTVATDVSCQFHAWATLPTEERAHRSHWIVDWVRPRASGERKSTWAVQPAASHFTGWAILVCCN